MGGDSMREKIDKIFNDFENNLRLYINSRNSRVHSKELITLQSKLKKKEQECEESKEACIEVAQKLRKTILMMNNVLENAD